MSHYNAVEKIWTGPDLPPLYNPNLSLGYLILNNLKTTPDRIIQVFDDTGFELTSKELYSRSIKIFKFLKNSGLTEGDIAGFLSVLSENLYAAVIACLTLGLPVNPLSHLMQVTDLVDMWSITKPKVIFCDVNLLKMAQEAVEKMKIECKIITMTERVAGYQFIGDIVESEDKESELFIIPSLSSKLTAFILGSSGSTGKVKGMIKTHKQLIWNTSTFLFQPSIDNLYSFVLFFPSNSFYWINTIAILLWTTLFGIKSIVTGKKLTAEHYMDMVDRHQVNFVNCFIDVLNMLKNSKNPRPMLSVKSVGIGGTVITKELIDNLPIFFPNAEVRGAYATTEIDLISWTYKDQKGTSCGLVTSNQQVKIIDDFNKNLGPNEKGEICVKSRIPFGGYFDNELKTAEAFIDGWFHTGDFGYFDDEGYLYLVDRKVHMIKYRHVRFSPFDIEEVINEIEGVAQCAVVAVDDPKIDITYAFVIKKPDSELTEEFVMNYVNSRVSEFKFIRGGVYFMEKFPTTVSNKIAKLQLRKIAEEIHLKKSKRV